MDASTAQRMDGGSRLVGVGVPALLIALLSPLLGLVAWLLTGPLFLSHDPLTLAPHEPPEHGFLCFALAEVAVSVVVGSRLRSTRQAWLVGAVGGAIQCAASMVSESSRGVSLEQSPLWSAFFLVAVTGAASAAGAWLAHRSTKCA